MGQTAHSEALSNRMNGITKAMQSRIRSEALTTRPEDIRAKAALVRAVMDKRNICTVGNSERIKAVSGETVTVYNRKRSCSAALQRYKANKRALK